MRTSEAFWGRKEFEMGCGHTQLMCCRFPLSQRNVVDVLMSVQACNTASRGYTMGKARPTVIARALASSATSPAERARILHRLVKLVVSKPRSQRLAWPCAARTKAHAGQGIVCRTIPGSGEPLRYLGGRLPALITTDHVPPFPVRPCDLFMVFFQSADTHTSGAQ